MNQDRVLEVIREVVQRGRQQLATASTLRISSEGWLKLELIHALREVRRSDEQVAVHAELDNVDVTVDLPDGRLLIELKTFPTNYGGAGKPFTNFIDGVVGDLEKLEIKGSDGTGWVVWIPYPVPQPAPRPWAGHLSKVEASAASTVLAETVKLPGSEPARLYVMESR